MKNTWIPLFVLGAIASFSIAGPASAFNTHAYSITLSGAQEVPPVVTPGTGAAIVTLDDVTGAVSISGTYVSLSSNATAAHLHGLAGPGVNAGILIGLTPTGGTTGSFSGSGSLSPAQVTGMLGGLTYVNVHTVANPGGEMRGQVVSPVPAMPLQWMAALVAAAVLGGAFFMARRPATA